MPTAHSSQILTRRFDHTIRAKRLREYQQYTHQLLRKKETPSRTPPVLAIISVPFPAFSAKVPTVFRCRRTPPCNKAVLSEGETRSPCSAAKAFSVIPFPPCSNRLRCSPSSSASRNRHQVTSSPQDRRRSARRQPADRISKPQPKNRYDLHQLAVACPGAASGQEGWANKKPGYGWPFPAC